MIDSTQPVFPNNVFTLLKTRMLQRLDPLENDTRNKIAIYLRPLRSSDMNQCIGIFPTWWMPDTSSQEIGATEPTVQTYPFQIQCLVKDAEEERAVAAHGIMSKLVKTTLYNDEPLKIGLAALAVNLLDTHERFQRIGIQNAQYLNNEIQGSFLYLSTLNAFVETETT